MRKDTIYSIRMSRTIREALKRAAQRERRTVASLLDKIITDYLEKEALLLPSEWGKDRRRFPRKKITLPAVTYLGTGLETVTIPCVVLDISKGGVLITYPKGSEVKISSTGDMPRFKLAFELPHAEGQIHLDCIASRINDMGSEIQIGAVFIDLSPDDLKKLEHHFP